MSDRIVKMVGYASLASESGFVKDFDIQAGARYRESGSRITI